MSVAGGRPEIFTHSEPSRARFRTIQVCGKDLAAPLWQCQWTEVRQMLDMRRRDFITFLGSAAAAPYVFWPLAARAQRSKRTWRIGVLMPFANDDPEGQARVAAFLRGLDEL